MKQQEDTGIRLVLAAIALAAAFIPRPELIGETGYQ